MAEWPKMMSFRGYDPGKGRAVPDTVTFEVVPAEIARELYEALLEADANRDATGGLDYHPCAAIVRYRREVLGDEGG